MLIPMSPTDAMFLLAESPTHPMHVGAVQVFVPPAGGDARDVAAAFENALATHEMSSALRRKASRSVSSLGQWSWQPDARYRVDNHVHRHTLSQPAGTAELWALCSRLHSGMLDRSRPLWEMHLIDGLADGRYAVYTKMHHAMADGVAAMRILHDSLSADPEQRGMAAAGSAVGSHVVNRPDDRPMWHPSGWHPAFLPHWPAPQAPPAVRSLDWPRRWRERSTGRCTRTPAPCHCLPPAPR